MKTKTVDQNRSLEEECEFLNERIAQLEKEIEAKALKYVIESIYKLFFNYQ